MKIITKEKSFAFLLPGFIVGVLLAVFLLPSERAYAVAMEPIYKVLQQNDDIKGIWRNITDLINYLIVAVLIFVAFAQILRINLNTYGVKKIIPSLIFAIVATNFSYLFCRFLVDIANVLLSLFVSPNSAVITNQFTNIIFDPRPSSDGRTITNLFELALDIVFIYASGILMFILGYLYLIRNWVIYFLVAISPIAFMSMVLPQTKSVFNQWWSNFVKWTFMPVVSIFWIWLGTAWFTKIPDSSNKTMLFVFALVCLYMAIKTPFSMGGQVMQQWGNLGKKVWNRTGGDLGKAAWRNTGGKGVGWAKNQYDTAKADLGNAVVLAGRNAWSRGTGFTKRQTLGRLPGGRNAQGQRQSANDWLNTRVQGARQGRISAIERRKLQMEGPELVRKKMVEDARTDAAERLVRDRGIPADQKSRFRSMLRSWVRSNSDAYMDNDLDDNIAYLRRNELRDAQGNVVGRGNYTSGDGLGEVMSHVVALKRRRRQTGHAQEWAQIDAFLNTLPLGTVNRTSGQVNRVTGPAIMNTDESGIVGISAGDNAASAQDGQASGASSQPPTSQDETLLQQEQFGKGAKYQRLAGALSIHQAESMRRVFLQGERVEDLPETTRADIQKGGLEEDVEAYRKDLISLREKTAHDILQVKVAENDGPLEESAADFQSGLGHMARAISHDGKSLPDLMSELESIKKNLRSEAPDVKKGAVEDLFRMTDEPMVENLEVKGRLDLAAGRAQKIVDSMLVAGEAAPMDHYASVRGDRSPEQAIVEESAKGQQNGFIQTLKDNSTPSLDEARGEAVTQLVQAAQSKPQPQTQETSQPSSAVDETGEKVASSIDAALSRLFQGGEHGDLSHLSMGGMLNHEELAAQIAGALKDEMGRFVGVTTGIGNVGTMTVGEFQRVMKQAYIEALQTNQQLNKSTVGDAFLDEKFRRIFFQQLSLATERGVKKGTPKPPTIPTPPSPPAA
ncbi:MAG: hypothetical protein WCT32_05560 [Patescibacteria group bacterium]|jgi:hypothetical protein